MLQSRHSPTKDKIVTLFCGLIPKVSDLTLLHSERPKLYAAIVFLRTTGLTWHDAIWETYSL